MLRKFSGLGLVVVLAVIGLVIAAPSQRTHHPALPAMDKVVTIHAGSYAVKTDGTSPNLVYPAWNFEHLYGCQMNVPSQGMVPVMQAFTDIGVAFITDAPQYQTMLAAGCETGNWIGIYIYDSSADWNGVQTYSWK